MTVSLSSHMDIPALGSDEVRISAILDANVLGSRVDRGMLLALANASFFFPLFSSEIIKETEEKMLPNIIKNSSDIPKIMKGINDEISINYPESIVTGYEAVKPDFELQDTKDMHVVKAAIHSGATVILTKDTDFSNEILNQHGLASMSPDEFIIEIVTPESVALAVSEIRRVNEKLFVKRPYDFDEFTKLLESKYGMLKVAKLLKDNRNLW